MSADFYLGGAVGSFFVLICDALLYMLKRRRYEDSDGRLCFHPKALRTFARRLLRSLSFGDLSMIPVSQPEWPIEGSTGIFIQGEWKTCPVIWDASNYLAVVDNLRLQLSRAKEWMQHDADCEGVLDPRSVECTCGLTEFLKELGNEC